MKNLFIKYTELFFGSWWSIIGHTFLFAIILVWSQDLLLFNTVVSIEAIYIGIFILMAEFREENAKAKKELNRHSQDRKLMKEDVDITQNVMKELKEIKKLLTTTP